MKIAISIQYGKRHLSYRGLMCEDGLLEGHAMLELGAKLAIGFEDKNHLALLLSYGSMKERADWVNRRFFDVVIGLSLTRGKPAVMYAEKFDSEGKTASLLAELLNNANIFTRSDIEYHAFPLKPRTSKLALVSYYNPLSVRHAFVISPFSCNSREYFVESEFINTFIDVVIGTFDRETA